MNDLISRQAAIEYLMTNMCWYNEDGYEETEDEKRNVITDLINGVPSAQPERMTNRQWICFLSAQFDISRTSAKEMLHGMMQRKKEDNLKKMFNGGRRVVKHEI
jgi:hypothetical protein